MESKVLELLIDRWMDKLLYDVDQEIGKSGEYEIESDKRKRPKALRKWVEAGYLSVEKGKYFATSEAWDLLPEEEPQLIGQWETYRKNHPSRFGQMPFVLLNRLPFPEKKYVIRHFRKFKWFLIALDGLLDQKQNLEITEILLEEDKSLGTVIKATTLQEYKKKQRSSLEYPFGTELIPLIQSAELVAHVKDTQHRARFDELFARNLKWALTTLAGISGSDSVKIQTNDRLLPFVDGGVYIGNRPEKWEENLTESIKERKKFVQELTEELEVMVKIQRKIESMGGWQCFLSLYETRLKEWVAEREAKGEPWVHL